MLKKWGIVAGMAVTVAAVLLAGGVLGGIVSEVAPVLAQDEPVDQPPFGMRFDPGFGGGWAQGVWTMFDTVAEALGLTPEDLFTESHSGKTLEEISEEQGVDMQTVYDAMQNTRNEAMRQRIQQGVEDGNLTQEQADWMLEGLEKGFHPGGPGFGRGFGLRHGPCGPLDTTEQ